MDTHHVETTGKTIDEAVETALTELHATREQVAIEILNHPRGGILGIGFQPARVRVTRLEAFQQPAAEATTTPPPEPDTEAADEERPSPATTEASPPEPPEETTISTEPTPDSEEAEPWAESEPEESVPTDENDLPGAYAQELLQRIVDRMGLHATAALLVDEPDEVQLDVEGHDLGILIGRQGNTLNAIQYLIGTIVSRKYQRRVRIIIDAEGYRQRRARSLEKMAQRAALQVRRTGRPYKTEYLKPQERRIVHLALQKEPGVFTYSEGEDPYRRVIIAPADDTEQVPDEVPADAAVDEEEE